MLVTIVHILNGLNPRLELDARVEHNVLSDFMQASNHSSFVHPTAKDCLSARRLYNPNYSSFLGEVSFQDKKVTDSPEPSPHWLQLMSLASSDSIPRFDGFLAW